MTAAKKTGQPAAGGEVAGREAAELELARQLAERAQAGGLALTGPGGLLGRLTKVVLEGALEGEMDAHLGYARHDPAGRDGGNSRNGHRAKTVLTDVGPVQIDMPRDRDASFAPKIVAKRQRRLGGVDDMVIALVAKGLTTGEVQNRGTRDVLMVVCDGLKGLPDAIGQVWPQAVTQTCVVHLLRNSFRYASRRDWEAIAKALRPVYTAPSESAALDAFAEFSGQWEAKYPAIVKLWESAWAEFVPFLRFDKEIRTLICTTNAIESLNARFRRSVKARGHFPTEQAALKHLFLVIISLDPTGRGRQRWSNRWKAALNAFDITFDGRLSAGRK